jgi:hypothetical protein
VCLPKTSTTSTSRERRWVWIALSGQDVEDHVGRMNAVGERLGAGGLDGGQIVGEHRSEDVDHLPIAVLDAGELASHTPSSATRSHRRATANATAASGWPA